MRIHQEALLWSPNHLANAWGAEEVRAVVEFVRPSCGRGRMVSSGSRYLRPPLRAAEGAITAYPEKLRPAINKRGYLLRHYEVRGLLPRARLLAEPAHRAP